MITGNLNTCCQSPSLSATYRKPKWECWDEQCTDFKDQREDCWMNMYMDMEKENDERGNTYGRKQRETNLFTYFFPQFY